MIIQIFIPFISLFTPLIEYCLVATPNFCSEILSNCSAVKRYHVLTVFSFWLKYQLYIYMNSYFIFQVDIFKGHQN